MVVAEVQHPGPGEEVDVAAALLVHLARAGGGGEDGRVVAAVAADLGFVVLEDGGVHGRPLPAQEAARPPRPGRERRPPLGPMRPGVTTLTGGEAPRQARRAAQNTGRPPVTPSTVPET